MRETACTGSDQIGRANEDAQVESSATQLSPADQADKRSSGTPGPTSAPATSEKVDSSQPNGSASAPAAAAKQQPLSAVSGKSTTSKETIASGATNSYCNRRTWITTERMNELRRRAQEAVKQNKTFTIRGCFQSVRNALVARGWVEKLDVHRKQVPSGVCQVTYDDLAQGLPKRKAGETRRQYIAKCERNIMSRFLEHMPIDFLWTNRKEKCDYIDQAKNPSMTINKFHRAPFTSKEGLCAQLKDFHWFYEEGTAEMYFPRCFNVWSLEELADFVENFKLTACIAVLRLIVDRYRKGGLDAIFSPLGTVPFTMVDFACKRCGEYLDSCQHKDIDFEDPSKVWEHEWDAFLHHHYQLSTEEAKIFVDTNRALENNVRTLTQLLEQMQLHWPQYTLDGYQNLWIIKPANKCRGRGIQLMGNLKKILVLVNPSIGSKSRYVVQKYIERPLTIHHTKFDIRQWFLITNVQPLVVWMYKESYLRFSSQQYSLSNHHESVHLTNHAIQKKYTNGKRDKRLPNENMWDCYSFQAYLRQIGKQDMWLERIYPGMKRAIVGTMLSSQENMDRRPNTFELFGADFMVSEDFYPWLIEINSSPDLGATTSVTARMCPQCLEDVVKVVIDRRQDPKADLGNFELIYRQMVPHTPAYMGLNLFVKGRQIATKGHQHHYYPHHTYKDRPPRSGNFFRQRPTLIPTISNVHKAMPTFNATEYIEKYIAEVSNSSRSSLSGISGCGAAAGASTGSSLAVQQSPMHLVASAHHKPPATLAPKTICPNLLRTPHIQPGTRRRSFTHLSKATAKAAVKDTPLGSQGAPAIKRHRSCGPTLNTTTTNTTSSANESDKNFKFIIRKCTIKHNGASRDAPVAEPAAAETTATAVKSKSEDNIIQLLHKTKAQQSPQSANGSQQQKCSAQPPQAARRHSSLTEKALLNQSWRSGRCQSLKAPRSAKAQFLGCEAGKMELRREGSAISMRTVGRGLITWRASRRSAPRNSTTATPMPTKSRSAYACRQIPAASGEAMCMRQFVSPRRNHRPPTPAHCGLSPAAVHVTKI